MLSPQLRIRGATLLIVFGALGSARALPRAVQQYQADAKPDATVPFVARFEALKPFAERSPSLGYLTVSQHLDPQRSDLVQRLYLAQFALAPHVIERRIDRDLVIFDSDRPEVTPQIAEREGWILVADLHNGVKLFRTGRQE
jgi:hypothetical protein